MKKFITTVILSSFVASISLAVDFASIIDENSKAQNDLHFKITETVTKSQIAAKESIQTKYIADLKETIHYKTSKDLLTYAKEKKQYKASTQQPEKRLAQEFKELE